MFPAGAADPVDPADPAFWFDGAGGGAEAESLDEMLLNIELPVSVPSTEVKPPFDPAGAGTMIGGGGAEVNMLELDPVDACGRLAWGAGLLPELDDWDRVEAVPAPGWASTKDEKDG